MPQDIWEESQKRQALFEILRCNESATALAVNGYISKWQYKRITKKLIKGLERSKQATIRK